MKKKILIYCLLLFAISFLSACNKNQVTTQPSKDFAINMSDSEKDFKWVNNYLTPFQLVTFSDQSYFTLKGGVGYVDEAGDVVWNKYYLNQQVYKVDKDKKIVYLSYDKMTPNGVKNLIKVDSLGNEVTLNVSRQLRYFEELDVFISETIDYTKELLKINDDGTFLRIESINYIYTVNQNSIIVNKLIDNKVSVASYDFMGNLNWSKEDKTYSINNHHVSTNDYFIYYSMDEEDNKYINKMDYSGSIIVKEQLNCRSGIRNYFLSDHHILILCENDVSSLLKLDENLDKVWESAEINPFNNDIRIYNDDVYAISPKIVENNLNYYLTKIDRNGTTSFETLVSENNFGYISIDGVDETGITLTLTIVVEEVALIRKFETYVQKFDHEGKEIFHSESNKSPIYQNVKEGIIITGINDDYTVEMYDHSGKLLWERHSICALVGYTDSQFNTLLVYEEEDGMNCRDFRKHPYNHYEYIDKDGNTLSRGIIIAREIISDSEFIYYVKNEKNEIKEYKVSHLRYLDFFSQYYR